MNRLKCISQRNSWCQLKRLQSSLSTSNSKIQIPVRIERGPTDILHALASTVPDDPIQISYVYHDDPFLLPLRRVDYRTYALSYEAGKKAAMWIHEQHNDLFVQHLSEPEIEAFRPIKYTDEQKVSEEMLLQAILKYRTSEALHIYKLLKTNVSNEAKQALLELLCFCTEQDNLYTNPYFERWYIKNKHKIFWQHSKEINELYQFLIKQDSLTAAAAYSTMICGLVKCSRIDEAWVIFQECLKAERLLNINAYNFALLLIPEVVGKKNMGKVQHMYDIFKVMNTNGIKPTIRTLNAALKVVIQSPVDIYDQIVKNLLAEYKNLNIEFSLGTYHYIMLSFYQRAKNSHDDFLLILNALENVNLTLQDSTDLKFFSHAMSLAYHYQDRDAGEKLHRILLFGNNRKFLSNDAAKNTYYSSYILLLLSTCTLDEFFHFYNKFCPKEHVPNNRLFRTIINTLKQYELKDIAEYVLKIWTDVNNYNSREISFKYEVLRIMKIDDLPADSPFKTAFANAALSLWTEIKNEIDMNLTMHSPLETGMTACIAIMLLHGGLLKESIQVLQYTVKESHLFIPTIDQEQLNKLFEGCISAECIEAALLVLEYAIKSGFSQTVEMGMKLKNLPQFTSNDHSKLINLLGVDALNMLDTSEKS
ncbi:Protein PTCD3 homolog, mitochondrial [Anthophora quadrimaculata]